MTVKADTVIQTLGLFEDRLRRVDYAINGHAIHEDGQTASSTRTSSAIAHLRTLERTLQSLASASPTVKEVLALQNRHPELFNASSSGDGPAMAPSSLAMIILGQEQLYRSVSARLSELQDNNIPDPAIAAKLTELRPRIRKVRERQLSQAREFAQLRARSASVVETWFEGEMLGMGERWADWEERLRDAEILVRRREAAKRREEGTV